MKTCCAAALVIAVACAMAAPAPERPKAGPVTILRSSALRPGMKGFAWTVFAGNEPEPVPVEILGLWKNAWGPKQDIILAKMGGKAVRTNVASGMSGSPVYVDGKLIGAVALRLSLFSPDAICGITPIELMLEINDYDKSLPADARTPDQTPARASVELPGEMLARVVAAGASGNLAAPALMTPIETPLAFSGFDPAVLQQFGPLFRELGVAAVQGGAGAALDSPKPAPGWQNALQPGDAVTGVLVSGDMSITGLGTVTYNDGKRVLAFGHPFFNLGPVDMPMGKGEILFTNASAFQPVKFGNATAIVGALHQDRHSGIQGVLGDTAAMVPVTVRVRSLGDDNSVRKQHEFHFHVFVQQKWTPYLMAVTLFNCISGLNDFREEATYRVSARVELAGEQRMSLSTMQAPGELSGVPAPMMLAGWWGDKFTRLFGNAVQTPQLKSVDATVDLLPERRVATIETAWIPTSEVEAGEEVPVRVFLRPYRGPQIERQFKFKIPATVAKGDHRILLSDADTLNRMQSAAAFMNRFIDVPQIVSLINQERSNDKLYVSLIEARPTVYYDDKTLPSLPASVLNVMQTGRAASRPFATSGETAIQEAAIPFDYLVNGSFALKVTVK
jgi:hypothetical protein